MTYNSYMEKNPMPDPKLTPPPELVQQWFAAWESGESEELSFANFVIPRAAQWGADMELEACCEWIADWYGHGCNEVIGNLRTSRRPKPPSLKEQALDLLDKAEDPRWDINDFTVVRRALEQLDD
jgi:hypothetical protein